MRNQIGFIPKSYKLQPDYYGKFFNNWAAIFLTKDGQEFHIELQGSFYNKEEAKHIEILKQNSTNRTVIFRDIKSIKQAVETLSNYFQKIGVLI